MLFLFFSPFLVLQYFSSINLFDFFIESVKEIIFLFKFVNKVVSFGDFDCKFSSKFSCSGNSSFTLSIKSGNFFIAFSLEVEDVFIISILFVSQIVFNIIEHVDQVRDWVSSSELELNSVEERLSEF